MRYSSVTVDRSKVPLKAPTSVYSLYRTWRESNIHRMFLLNCPQSTVKLRVNTASEVQ